MQGSSIDVRQLFEQHRSRRSWAANPQTSARLTCQVAPGGVVYHSTSLERSDRWHWFVWLSVRRPSPATLRQKQTRQSLLAHESCWRAVRSLSIVTTDLNLMNLHQTHFITPLCEMTPH